MEFTEIFKTYQTPIYNYILRMAGNPQDAEDITQETFIKVFKNLSSFRGESSLKTWVYKIATNVTLNHFNASGYKKSAKTDIFENEDDLHVSGNSESDKILSIEEKLIKEEMSECVRDFIDQLPDDYKTVLILHDLQGFKNREITEILSESLDNVKIRLHRARKKMRTALVSFCTFYGDKNGTLSCGCERQGENWL